MVHLQQNHQSDVTNWVNHSWARRLFIFCTVATYSKFMGIWSKFWADLSRAGKSGLIAFALKMAKCVHWNLPPCVIHFGAKWARNSILFCAKYNFPVFRLPQQNNTIYALFCIFRSVVKALSKYSTIPLWFFGLYYRYPWNAGSKAGKHLFFLSLVLSIYLSNMVHMWTWL